MIVVGIAQILLRARMARANAASNREMFNGRFASSGWQSYNRTVAVLVGAVFIVAGLLLLIGVLG